MYQAFCFEEYSFDGGVARFRYSFDHERYFEEKITFPSVEQYDQQVFDRVRKLAFLIVGVSYYKCFPTRQVDFGSLQLSKLDAELFMAVYHDGMSQFMFENKLGLRDMLADIRSEHLPDAVESVAYDGEGILTLQSGGKDSLLVATMLEQHSLEFLPWYMSQNGGSHPLVLDNFETPLRVIERDIDRDALKQAREDGGLNGHVPVTYITFSLALMDAVLNRKDTVLVAIGQEGNEPHEYIGDLPVNHQWAKTWQAEQLFMHYIQTAITTNLRLGSPLRGLTELRVAELFVERAWARFGHSFSSCNLANYQQAHDNQTLVWCGECPKCANSFLLFAPFVDPAELQAIFNSENLLQKPGLVETYKGLLGIDGVMKPFECVGEVDELRLAYQMANDRFGAMYALPFDVPSSNFDYKTTRESQSWASDLLY